MSPRLTPGFAPWRPIFVAKLPELEDELRLELGPIRARTLALELVDNDASPVLVVRVDSGDPDRRATTLFLEAWLGPIVEVVPAMRLEIVFVERPRLRVVG